MVSSMSILLLWNLQLTCRVRIETHGAYCSKSKLKRCKSIQEVLRANAAILEVARSTRIDSSTIATDCIYTWYPHNNLLTLGVHAQRGLLTLAAHELMVVGSVCVCVSTQHLTYRMFICPTNDSIRLT